MSREQVASPHDLQAELRALEQHLLDPAVRRDPARVAALLTPDFQEFGSSGRAWIREEILSELAGEPPLPNRTLSEFQVITLSADHALVTYRSSGLSQDGSGREVSSLRSSLWVRDANQHWRMRFHQGTRCSSPNDAHS